MIILRICTNLMLKILIKIGIILQVNLDSSQIQMQLNMVAEIHLQIILTKIMLIEKLEELEELVEMNNMLKLEALECHLHQTKEGIWMMEEEVILFQIMQDPKINMSELITQIYNQLNQIMVLDVQSVELGNNSNQLNKDQEQSQWVLDLPQGLKQLPRIVLLLQDHKQ